MKIGICGGTFDPIHMGHLIIAERVRCHYRLNKVLFLPSGMPPHKNLNNVTDSMHRLNMVRCSVKSNPHFEASDIEVNREGYTYTVDTLKELRELYAAGTEFYYIVGADVVRDLLAWKQPEEVFKLTRFIAVMRPGFANDEFKARIKLMKDNYDADIYTFEAPQIEISSTYVRDMARKKQSVKYLVDDCVEEYIIKNKLYL